jgi:hypothetical protein
MESLRQVETVLLSLSDPVLRVAWLDERLQRWPAGEAARLLDRVCEESERSDPRAREALLAVAMLFAGLGASPRLEALRQQARAERLLGLDRMLRRGSKTACAAGHETAVPDYGAGRELTLGERRSLARRPNRRAFDKLLFDPHPLVIRQLLENPRLTEADVLGLVTRRPARLEVIAEIARSPRWLSRRRIRLAILFNPGSPTEITQPLLPICTRTELREILGSPDTAGLLRATAVELLERRPPIRRGGSDFLQ